MRRGLAPVATGLLVGMPAAAGASLLVRDQLFGVVPGDPAALGVAGATLVAAALLALMSPARKALRIEPMDVLRSD